MDLALDLGGPGERVPPPRLALAGIPGVQLYQAPPQPLTPNGMEPNAWAVIQRLPGKWCTVRVFVDGRATDASEVVGMEAERMRSIEVFVKSTEEPEFARAVSTDCGSVVVTTVR